MIEKKDFYIIYVKANNLENVLSEFNNYVLDIASTKELGK